MNISRSLLDIIVIILVMVVLLSACGVTDTASVNLIELPSVELTPTMHTAFQLTPAAERMPDPIPVGGFGMYVIEGLGGSFSEQPETGTETAVSNPNEDTAFIVGGGSSGSALVEGNLASPVDALVVNQVVVITPLPQTTAPVKSVSAVGNATQPIPTTTPSPAAVIADISISAEKTPSVALTPTPTPICGGNLYHNVGPANRVDKMPIDFEDFGSWMRSENTYGAFLQTDLLQKSGSHAAWLCYFFNTLEDETAVFTQIHPIPGQPNTVRLWVYGNRSGHYLGVWLLDKELETWLVPLGPILHEGWEEMEATFAGPDAELIFYISGPSNDRIDFPVSFRGISLNDSPDASITYGGVIIDDITFITK